MENIVDIEYNPFTLDSHILEKYDILYKIGQGAYGDVYKAIDKKTKEVVALKKSLFAFHNHKEALRTYKEIRILNELNGHENIIRLLNVIKPQSDKEVYLYLVFEYMDTNLFSVISANVIESIHKKFIIYQILRAVKYIHSTDIIHCDLRPDKVLINSDTTIKLCDFGFARSVDSNDFYNNDYLMSNWYKSPELLLGSNKYTKSSDMWSIGCIIAEVLTGKILFQSTSILNQLSKVMEITGKPNKYDIEEIHSEYMFPILDAIPAIRKKPLQLILQTLTTEEVEFINNFILFNPNKRISAEDALKHPYLKYFHDQMRNTEISANRSIKLHIDEKRNYSVGACKQMLINDVVKMKKRIRRKQTNK